MICKLIVKYFNFIRFCVACEKKKYFAILYSAIKSVFAFIIPIGWIQFGRVTNKIKQV